MSPHKGMTYCENMNCQYGVPHQQIERISDYKIVDGVVLCTACYEDYKDQQKWEGLSSELE